MSVAPFQSELNIDDLPDIAPLPVVTNKIYIPPAEGKICSDLLVFIEAPPQANWD